MGAEERVSTLLGDPKKAVVAMALPIILALLVAEVNSLADRAWCSGLGMEALAAISVVRPVYNTFVGLGTGLGVGAAAVISRYIGAQKNADASKCAGQSLVLGLIFAIIITPILLLLQRPLLELIGSADVMELTMNYMYPFTACLVIIVLNGVIGGTLNGQGAASLSTSMMFTLAISNMILDPIFIYGFGMGITGASIATVLATVLSMCLGIWFLTHRGTILDLDRSCLHPDRGHMRSIAIAGIPQMVEFVIMYFMDAVLNKIVISCAGSEGLTIYSTPDAVVAIIIVPAMAIGSALVAVASSAYGQKDMDRMNTSFKYALKIGLLITICLVIIAELIPGTIMTLFTYSSDMEQYRDVMSDALRILALYAPLFAFTPICSGYLQAMKYPNRSVILAVVRNLILIGLFIIAGQYSLFAIFHALDTGHLCGAIIVFTVTYLTYRSVRRKAEEGTLVLE